MTRTITSGLRKYITTAASIMSTAITTMSKILNGLAMPAHFELINHSSIITYEYLL
jgi:hypothetical protein